MKCSSIVSLVIALFSAAMIPVMYMMKQSVDAEQTRRDTVGSVNRPRVVHMKAGDLYNTVIGPTEDKRRWANAGPNDQDVVWAVFFHKPYCGACRRLRPIFEALGASTNETGKLRFAMYDCVANKVFCDREGVTSQPRIRLYKYPPPEAPKQLSDDPVDEFDQFLEDDDPYGTGRGRRVAVREWAGMLINYVVVEWFHDQRASGVIPSEVQYADEQTLAHYMLRFKMDGEAQHDSAIGTLQGTAAGNDRGGFVSDITSALHVGMYDQIFEGTAPLSARRLRALIRFIDVVSQRFPVPETRARFLALLAELRGRFSGRTKGGQKRPALMQSQYLTLLRYARVGPFHAVDVLDGAAESATESAAESALDALDSAVEEEGEDEDPIVALAAEMSALDLETLTTPTEYRWCANPGGAPGVGGYPCGLWLLFHTLLANSGPTDAQRTLTAVHDFVQHFFGCRECAAHFETLWQDGGGAALFERDLHHPAIDTGVWLWQAHNRVRARITKVDDTVAAKRQWPSLDECPQCYSRDVHDGIILDNDVEWDAAQWEDTSVFVFLQELLCYKSDSYACAQFYDPS
jgi:thiol-disulfide isomerase/thioredoxin